MLKKQLCMILLVLMIVPIFVLGAQGDDPFPIKPGSDEWKSFTSHTQKVAVLQLPGYDLETMSTDELLQVCLNYPMALEIMAYDNPQQGIEAIIRQFNGLQELMKREDAAILLLENYSKLNPKHLDENWTLVKKGNFAFKFRYIELLLAQDKIFSKLNTNQRHQLLKESIQKFESKKKNPEVFGLSSLSTPTLLMVRILEKDNNQSFKQKIGENKKLNVLRKTARLVDLELLDQLVTEARESFEK
jgi:hypothetical protein